MVKTRSQTGELGIKKEEEEEEDRKPTLTLGSASNTRNKITKPKSSKNKNSIPLAPDIKVEEDIDVKSLLQSASNHSKLPNGRCNSQEQINQLIDYVVNHGMNVSKASRMVKMSCRTAYYYYNQYKNDSEKKIPAPRNRSMYSARYATQKQIENFIRYINGDKMTIAKASAKANMNYQSGRYYYNKYLKGPNYNISKPRLHQYYTQDQKQEFIGYIVNNKMTIKEASLKAKIHISTGKTYYRKYFDVQNPDIPTPSHIAISKRYTQEQKKEVISYIVNDKMSIIAASRKAKISASTCSDWYHKYFKNQNPHVITPSHITIPKRYTQEQKTDLISYIVDDKMSIAAASRKVNMSPHSAGYWYRRYLKDKNTEIYESKFRNGYTQDDINKLVGYIADDYMTILAASKKANMSYKAGRKYYRKYLNGQKRDTSI